MRSLPTNYSINTYLETCSLVSHTHSKVCASRTPHAMYTCLHSHVHMFTSLPSFHYCTWLTSNQTNCPRSGHHKRMSRSYLPLPELSSRGNSTISESLSLSSPWSVVNSASSWFSSFWNPFLDFRDMSLPFPPANIANSASTCMFTLILFRAFLPRTRIGGG